MSLCIWTHVSSPSDIHTNPHTHTELITQTQKTQHRLSCNIRDQLLSCHFYFCFLNISSFIISYWMPSNPLHCFSDPISPQDNKSLHQSLSYVSLIFSYIRITKHTLGQCTVANKFLTNPTLLALMCNLGAHSVLPEGNTASACLCVSVSVCVCGPSDGLSLARSPTGSHREASWCTLISNPALMKIWLFHSISHYYFSFSFDVHFHPLCIRILQYIHTSSQSCAPARPIHFCTYAEMLAMSDQGDNTSACTTSSVNKLAELPLF